ncbi:hypothetical protein BGX38DRAFT_1280180 [Terfezia claveryi]|nr:hypothetical protein BGX38DRAFT_1280180 [Terfezia claveryi]
MPLKKRKLGNVGTTSDGGGVDSGDDDYGTRQFADKLGFNDPGVPNTLYQDYRSALNQLMQDVAKKARKSRQVMWESIADARAAYDQANPGVAIEPLGRLPNMGRPTAEPPYMPMNQGSQKARTESVAERLRAAARARRPPPSPILASPLPPPAPQRPPVPAPAPQMQRLAPPVRAARPMPAITYQRLLLGFRLQGHHQGLLVGSWHRLCAIDDIWQAGHHR